MLPVYSVTDPAGPYLISSLLDLLLKKTIPSPSALPRAARVAGFSLASSAVGAATLRFSSDALNAAIRSITWPRRGLRRHLAHLLAGNFYWAAACRSWPAPVRDCRQCDNRGGLINRLVHNQAAPRGSP